MNNVTRINIEEKSERERWYWLDNRITSLSGSLNCWPAPFPHNPNALDHERVDVRLMAHIFKIPGIVYVCFSEHMLGITIASFATWKAIELKVVEAVKTALATDVIISESNEYVSEEHKELVSTASEHRSS